MSSYRTHRTSDNSPLPCTVTLGCHRIMERPIMTSIMNDSTTIRDLANSVEPRSLRTYTPSQAVLAESAGVFHWTPEGRRLYDFTSGVLVANLGHNPTRWMQRFSRYMGWPTTSDNGSTFFRAVPMTSYNAITPLEAQASVRLIKFLRARPGGFRMEQVLWAASGSEAIQKALWACMAYDKTRPMILATRHGFHGKKGLSYAVSGSETEPERDPRVAFVPFPRNECNDVSLRSQPFDPAPYINELDQLVAEHGDTFGTFITEPYLGGGGSYHPPKAFLQAVEKWCHDRNILFILDEVQSNFGRTGKMFAYETYGLEPDLVVLGKGLGNGVPVAAVVGRRDVFNALSYGDASDTWSANALNAASVMATLDEFESSDVLGAMRESSRIIEAGLVKLKEFPFVEAVRGEQDGMVWGVEFSTPEYANGFVLNAYQGDGGDGVHLLGPLAKKVIRISPPLVITSAEATAALNILHATCVKLSQGLPFPAA
jgi:4-aminobutyrate aminotransferase-like enzyme